MFESLEDRRLLATIMVTGPGDNIADGDGQVTLREAIIAANTNVSVDGSATGEAGADVIEFAFPTGVTGPINLSGSQLQITEALTINGLGQDVLTIDAQGNSRIFEITAGDVTINGLTLTGGNVIGVETAQGGAIRSTTTGTLTILASTISGNTANAANTVATGTANATAQGGGIYTAGGTLTVIDSTIVGNAVNASATTSTDNDNSNAANAISSGAGIASLGVVSITNSQITGNTASGSVAGYLMGSRFAGGGLYSSGQTDVVGSTIANNSAGEGAGVRLLNANATITDSTIRANTAAGIGGGVLTAVSASLDIVHSTISENVSGNSGGGVSGTGATINVTSSTISGNTAARDGGGLRAIGAGSLTVRSSTITGNRANSDDDANGDGGGIFSSAPTTLTNTIVAGNTSTLGAANDLNVNVEAASSFNLIGDPNTAGGLAHGDANNNIVGQSDGGAGRVLLDIATVLGPLQDNGGLTFTHALLAGSPAIDTGVDLSAQGITTDQRGIARPQRVATDIGAYEREPRLTGNLFQDDNVNGVREIVEFGVANVLVEVWQDGGDGNVDFGAAGGDDSFISNFTTDFNGNYVFNEIADGTYHLRALTPPQYAVTVPNTASIAVGAALTAGSVTKVFPGQPNDGLQTDFAQGIAGEVRVGSGDFNGDGVADLVTGAGPGQPPTVQVFNAINGAMLHNFNAFDAAFTGGVFVAAGDVNNDGTDDIIVGADAGAGSQVMVFSGVDLSVIHTFLAYDPAFTGGVRVATGDINGDGFADIITGAGPGAAPHVRVFDGRSASTQATNTTRDFFAFDQAFLGGVYVAGGDVNGDGFDDVIVGSGADGSPAVTVFSGGAIGSLLASFVAYDPGFLGGVRVATGDVNADGFADIITGTGPGSGPHVKVFSGLNGGAALTELQSFFAFDAGFNSGVFVNGMAQATYVDIATVTLGSSDFVRNQDHAFTLLGDFGDAPDGAAGTGPGNYQTRLADDGPRHHATNELAFGGIVAADNGKLQNAAADADQEEFSIFNPLDLRSNEGLSPQITIDVLNFIGQEAMLFGWIDYNADGVFDNDTERTSLAIPDQSAGFVTLEFPEIPFGSAGQTYARFRLSTDPAAANPFGLAVDGEVEDYVFNIGKTQVDAFDSSFAEIELIPPPTAGITTAPGTPAPVLEFRPAAGTSVAFDQIFPPVDLTEMRFQLASSGAFTFPLPTETKTYDVIVSTVVEIDGEFEEVHLSGELDITTDSFDSSGSTLTFLGAISRLELTGTLASGESISMRHSQLVPSPGTTTVLSFPDGSSTINSSFELSTELKIGEFGPFTANAVATTITLVQVAAPEVVRLYGTTTLNTYFEGASLGDAIDDSMDGFDEVKTEIASLELTGTSAAGPITVRVSSASRSLGELVELVNNTPGLLDVDPFAPGNANSLFDVSFEIEVGGEVLHTAAARRIAKELDNATPVAGEIYEGIGDSVLFKADNMPVGFSLGKVFFEPAAARPTVVVDIEDDSLNDTDNVSVVTFEFSEEVFDFDETDIGVSNGTLSDFLKVDADSYTANFTATDGIAGLGAVQVNGAYFEARGIQGSVSDISFVPIDTLNPTVVITLDDSALIIGETAVVTFTFSEPPTGFADEDITVQGGTLSAVMVNAANAAIFTATFTPTVPLESATNTISVNTNYTDGAGNTGTAGASANFTVDTIAPTVAITLDDSALIIGETAVVTFTFSEPPTGFADEDITVQGGTLSAVTVNAANAAIFTATFTPTAGLESATNAISVSTGYTDPAGNTGTAGTSANYIVDTLAPTVTIAFADNVVAAGATSIITVSLSEIPMGVTPSDVTVEHGTLSGFSATANPLVFVAVFTAETNFNGTATVTISNDYTDVAGNPGTGTSATILVQDRDFTLSKITATVSESGTTDTFTVVLDSQPTTDVVLTVVSGNTDEATVEVATLTFTNANWDQPQTITVTGVDDTPASLDGDQTTTITIAVDDANSDAAFDAVADKTVTVTTTDNDGPGFTVAQSGGSTSVSESGTTDTFTVVLNVQPTSNVVINVSANGTTEATVDVTTLTFTNANWDQPQTVTVTGADDAIDDGNQNTVLTLSIDDASSDAAFAGVADQIVTAVTVDDDTRGITVSAISGNTTEAGGTATFTVVLNSQPTADVMIGLTSSDTTEGTVTATPLTFTAANWDQPQNVTVTGVSDTEADGDVTYTVITAAATGGDYAGIDPADVSVINVDGNTAGFTLSTTTATVSESGTTDSFTVVLDSQPTSNVVLTVVSGNTDEATVDVTTLTFTSENWDQPQTVTITGVDDTPASVDGDQTTTITVAVDDANSDDAFDSLADKTVTVTTLDNDGPGFTVVQSGGSTSVSESGTTDTFTVVLNAQPTSNVVITVAPNRTTEATIDVTVLTFTSANWDQPQTVTVTGVNDAIDDGNQNTVLTLSIDDAASDAAFAGVADQTVTAVTVDDDTSGITVSAISGNTTEAGGTATFTVVLNSQPTADVTIGLTSDDPSEGTLGAGSLLFTTANWDQPQTVTVTGVNDDVDDGDVAFNIVTAAATGGDYAGIDAANVPVTNTDDDTRGVTVSAVSGNTTEAGGTATFTVVLDSQPIADVMIGLSSDDTSEGTITAAQLTFTTANWNVPQTVTVTGVDDDVDDGDITFNIITAVAIGGDYSNVDPSDVAVTNVDNDTAGFTLSKTTATVSESGTSETLTVVLNSQPTSNVLLSVVSGNTSEATVDVPTLTFTNANWNVPQTVTITGVNDTPPAADGDQTTTITVSIVDAQSDDTFDALADKTVSVTTLDNDGPGFTVAQSGGSTSVSESGTTDTFTVVLNAQPVSNVVVTVTSADTGEATASPTTLTFTPNDWDQPQAVTVTGISDGVIDADQTTIVTLSIDDANSDDAFDGVANQTVSVTTTNIDVDTAPQITAPASITVEGDIAGGASLTGSAVAQFLGGASATDDIDPNPTITNNALTSLALGPNVITFTATDSNGNSSTASATITVVDTVRPTPTAPANISVTTTSTTGVSATLPAIAAFLSGATATDVVDATPTITNNAPAVFPIGQTTVTFTAIDDAGNSQAVTAVVTVNLQTTTTPVVNVSPSGPNGEPDSQNLPGTTSQPTSWSVQRSSLRELTIDLPAPLTTVAASDLVLTNLGVNADVDPDVVITLRNDQLTLVNSGMQLRITFDVGQLTDGIYKLDLLTGITGGNTFTMIGDSTNKFYVLTGDWNGSGAVTPGDFATFAYWFGQDSAIAPRYVDLIQSASIGISDFAPFAAGFGKSIVFPSAGTGSPVNSGGEGELTALMNTLVNPADVDGDGTVTAGDALTVIYELSQGTSAANGWSPHDVNRDGNVTASDALFVINDLYLQTLGSVSTMAVSHLPNSGDNLPNEMMFATFVVHSSTELPQQSIDAASEGDLFVNEDQSPRIDVSESAQILNSNAVDELLGDVDFLDALRIG